MFKISEPSFLSSPTPGFLSFADPHHFNADPDPTFHINADGGGGGRGWIWSAETPGLHCEPPRLHCERPRLPLRAFKAPEFLL